MYSTAVHCKPLISGQSTASHMAWSVTKPKTLSINNNNCTLKSLSLSNAFEGVRVWFTFVTTPMIGNKKQQKKLARLWLNDNLHYL